MTVIARSASDEAIQTGREALDCFASLAMTKWLALFADHCKGG
jgi:hypothetical protein